MKKANLLKLGLAAAVALGAGTAAAETIDGTATATVLEPLTVTETTALAFGDVYASSTAGEVTVSSAGAVSATNGAGFVAGTGATQATFDISGAISTAITISMVTAGAQLDDATAAGGGAPMTLTAFTTNPGVLPNTTDGAGAATFDVGATLNVNANQAAQIAPYSTGTGDGVPYTVTVNYN